MHAPGDTADRIRVYRICRAMHAAEAFSGEGARRFGGRWNSRGVAVVYGSSSLSLAAMEYFVHLEPVLAPDDLVWIAATLPEAEAALTVESAELPAGWRGDELVTRELGDAWVRAQSSLALRVPSAVIPLEWNVVMNPLHPRMAEVTIEAPQPFAFDARMFR